MRILAGLFIMIVFFVSNNFAQNHPAGKVEIIAEPGIQELVEKHIMLNEKQDKTQGYRIQIFFNSGNNSKNNANKVRAEFMAEYPGTEAYIIFQEPHFKVRVGDFRTRLDAQGMLKNISRDYPNAFIVKDEINFPPL